MSGRYRIQIDAVIGSIDAIPDAIPTGLAVTGTTSSTITLDWDDNTEPDFASYTVYRAPDGVNFAAVATGVTSSTYTDTGLDSGTPYWYKVSAVDDSTNESNQSEAVQSSTDSIVFAVYPISTDPLTPFYGQEAVITNTSATWEVTAQSPLDGAFSDFGVGGTYKYTKGSDAGEASFTYTVYDYDGTGADIVGATWSITVQ